MLYYLYMQTKPIERYFFFGLLLATLLFTFFIFRPFWIVIVLGISFSIVLYPIYEWFTRLKFPSWLAAFITVSMFIAVVIVLLFSVGVVILNQSQNVYDLVVNNENALTFVGTINTSINKMLPPGFTFNLYEKITSLVTLISNNIAGLFASTLSTVFSLFLIFLSIFYFLKDNERWKRAILVISPLSDAEDKKIIKRFAEAVNGIIRGYFLVTLIQGTLVAIGFTLFGIPNPLLWGLVAVVAAFVPTIGTGLVSIPAIAFLYITGNQLEALGLLFWAVAMVSTIDNILNPIVIGKRINLSPLLILFSVLGGLSLFGPVGILVGPLTVSMLYTLISIYRDELKQSTFI